MMTRTSCVCVVAVGALCGSAFGDTGRVTTTFDVGQMEGDWTYGLGGVSPTGGFPGPFLQTSGLDTFAPQLRTQGESMFTGDYRAAGVVELRVDLNTFTVDFSAAGRPLTVMLMNDSGTPANPLDDYAFFLMGPDNIPEPGDGWLSYSFEVPSQETSTPVGWDSIAFGPGSPVDPDWNDVITDVSQVVFFYGNPKFFFIFQQWALGADNIGIRFCPAVACPGDLTGDGQVTTSDLTVLLGNFGMSVTPGTGGDLTGDGEVTTSDLTVFLGLFGIACEG